MKKTVLIIASFCISILNVFAQISITSADMAIPTKVYYQANDTLPTILVGNAGPNQTWNMTAVVQHTWDTTFILPYSSSPNPAFPTADVALKQGSQNFYGYLHTSLSSLTVLGGGGVMDVMGTPIAINQIYSPGETLFNFPTSYDTSFTNNYSSNAKFFYGQVVQGFSVDSVWQKSGVQKTSIVDAWGTLTTPLSGGPYNVIRIKETKITHDTALAYVSLFSTWTEVLNTADSTTTYSWWANGIGTALATATMDSTGGVFNFQWLTAPPTDPPVLASASSSDVTCPGACDGTATATASWGIPPYTYSWNTVPVQNTASIGSLCVGNYTVTITDSTSATATATVTINPFPQPVITSSGTHLSTNYSATSFQWYLNDSIISGATSSTYTVTQNGSYTVFVSNGGSCNDTSAAFIYNYIGINESTFNTSIAIYPNPVNNQINIKFDISVLGFLTSAKQAVFCEIKNELGQSVKKVNIQQLLISKDEVAIDVADLKGGIYFIQIISNDSIFNQKFIKQ